MRGGLERSGLGTPRCALEERGRPSTVALGFQDSETVRMQAGSVSRKLGEPPTCQLNTAQTNENKYNHMSCIMDAVLAYHTRHTDAAC